MLSRITTSPRVCHGEACVAGTRIPVHQVIRMLANGDTMEDLVREYPPLKREDILACLDYAASLAEEEVTPVDALTAAAVRGQRAHRRQRHAVPADP